MKNVHHEVSDLLAAGGPIYQGTHSRSVQGASFGESEGTHAPPQSRITQRTLLRFCAWRCSLYCDVLRSRRCVGRIRESMDEYRSAKTDTEQQTATNGDIYLRELHTE